MRNKISAKKIICGGEHPPRYKGFDTQNAFSLPPLRYAQKKAMLLCDSPRTKAVDLLRIITLDPTSMCLTFRLYSYYFHGTARNYTNIEHVIIALTVNTVKNTILNTYEPENDSSNATRDAYEEKIILHSIATAVFANLLAKERTLKNGQHIAIDKLQEYWSAALLHDVGKLADSCGNTGKKASVDHCKAGAAIAAEYQLPQPLTDTISYHHSVNKYTGKSEDVLCNTILANFFSNKAGYSCGRKEKKKLAPAVLKTLNLNEEDCKVLFEKIKPEFQKQFKNVQKFLMVGG
ncbi:MAG: HDOD domain-containing protein [Termitinemataceae bacterium]|nr:MAG: HDOD domain-containing protein [Termitinemataceae bacterium]